MKLLCLGCEALARLVYLNAAYSPHIVDVEIFRLGLHNTPDSLRETLQSRIDAAQGKGYDAILLAYGLCGKSTHGLVSRDTRMVIPRAHDCITLFLGSRSRYAEEFTRTPGTYWYALDYLQRNEDAGTSLSLGASDLALSAEKNYQEYVKKYGKDNADYLMSVMGAWQQHYQRAAYIDMGVGDGSEIEERAKKDAERRGWTFERMQGDFILIKRLIFGDWDGDFLTVMPGQRIAQRMDEEIVQAEVA